MKSDLHVAAPPPKPLIVFDGDCNFCTLWIHRWRQITGDTVDYLPSQAAGIGAQFPEIPPGQFQTAIQLIETDGAVYSGAQAVFRVLSKNPGWQWPLAAYELFPGISRITESAYGFVAGHRTFFSRLTRWLWGRHVELPDHFLTRWFFLRALGLIYLVAFVSLWSQIGGLVGHGGILPADQFMSAIKQHCDARGIGPDRFRLVPTLCWFDSSDGFLDLQCAAGTACALLLIVGLAPVPCLALLWLLYLSLATVGQDFLGFQWDYLLLEAGFLAIFFAPLQWLPRPSRESPPSRILLWLLRLLLFKLMFSSGCVKLLSGDPAWRDLTALTFHYQTQPLPTWPGWYANQLPLWLQKCSCVAMFAIELGAPWLIFAPRRIRFLGAGAMIGLQTLILLTGNYTFFNFLTLALCLLLLDDFVIKRILTSRFCRLFCRRFSFNRPPATGGHFRRWPKAVTIPLAAVVVAISLYQVASMFGAHSGLWYPAADLDAEMAPFRTVNSYGLFAVMTTTRNEIIIEGSNDGVNWLPYEFKYKPGDVNRRPAFVEPFQPRLDWQMWFAALGDYRQNPWVINFCARLLQGSPEVLALLAKNPFPEQAPRYLRARLYEYHFTNLNERRASGAWWKREPAGDYLPPFSLADLQENEKK
ncbi:MAG TPA: lipase maturation factor family protein [Candidatus Sulfotelmatobacter sp.]|nr:lipase maturation factor family protein [Candidatus Sulfotelmatobacter sp.]